MPRDLLKVYEKAQRERQSQATDRCSAGRWGPVDSMLESLRVDTGGLHLTFAPPAARMFLTYKNKLKCRAILDARQVNSSDPKRPPKFRVPALEGIRRWMGDAKRNRGGGGGAECSLLSRICKMHTGASGSPPCLCGLCGLCGGGRFGAQIPICPTAVRVELQSCHLPTACHGGAAAGAF